MPIGDANLTRNLESYTLNEFKTLAESSRDNQELRIRKSNQELSNTPLGFIARNFGSTHETSNTRVTQAFRHALQTDPKYRTIAARLAGVLSAQMPANQPLTAATVKNAIGMADRMLASQEKAISLAEMSQDFNLIGQAQFGAFKSFAMEYLFNHPEVKIDLGDIGEKLTGQQRHADVNALQPVLRQQEGAKLEALATVIKAFYKQAGAGALAQGGYGISPSQTGGDAQKAAAITKFLTEHGSIPDKTDEILDHAFNPQDAELPKNGRIAKPFKNALSKFFAGQLGEVGLADALTGLKHMKAEDINRLAEVFRTAGSRMQSWAKTRALKIAVHTIDTFVKQHPALAAQPEKMEQALSQLTDALAERLNAGRDSLSDITETQEELSVRLLLNEQGLTVNGESLLAKNGLEPKVALAALSQPSAMKQIIAKVRELGKDRTDEQIAQAVRSEAERMLAENADALKKVADAKLPDNLIAAGVKTALAIHDAMACLGQVQGRNEEQMLEKLQAVASALGDKSLTDAERGLLLKNLTGEFAKALPGGTEQLCRDNLPVFARLVGQLHSLSGDASLSKLTRDACTRVAEIAQAIYNHLLALAPEEIQSELALMPEPAGPANPQLAAGANPLKSFPRNASPARMFAALQELQASKLTAEEKAYCRRSMEALGCPDYKLIALASGESPTALCDQAPDIIGSTKGYKVISHLHNDLSALGHSFRYFTAHATGFDPAQAHEFFADVYLSGLTTEQKKNLLNTLKDPAVRDFLQVANSYAQKNNALPDNSVVPELLRLGNNGQELVEITKVLQIAADKIAQELGEAAPGPIFDPNGTKTMLDLSKSFGFDENFPGHFTRDFRKYCNAFDTHAYLVGNHLTAEQHDAVKKFYGSLKVPVAGNGINKVHGQVPEKDIPFSYTDALGHRHESAWTTDMLGIMFAYSADEVSQLLESTGGHPDARQLWGILHGGQPPAGLTMDNFADKLMRSVCQQIHTLGTLLGKPLTPEFFLSTCCLKIGIHPMTLINKILESTHGDVKFTVGEQTGKSGMFPQSSLMGKTYENGHGHYAFGFDFIRAIMPPGAQPGPQGQTGCKITVQPEQGDPVEFHQSDYAAQPQDDKEGYLAKIPAEVRKLCQTTAQLAGVGVCTTQAIQGGLRTVPFFYSDITGGGFEHTALDHHISKLANGNVLVKVSEKPGSLFKFDMQFEVAPDGMVSVRPESSFTLPSLQKVRAYQEANPGRIN